MFCFKNIEKHLREDSHCLIECNQIFNAPHLYGRKNESYKIELYHHITRRNGHITLPIVVYVVTMIKFEIRK